MQHVVRVEHGAGGTGGCSFAGSLVPTGDEQKSSRIRTGLLPAFATFEAKGKEGGVDLGMHFGFAPQINNAGGVHDKFGNGTQAGAQIDMRQVYLTAGGTWGQILAGREIGLYQRNNILNDMTLFGVGAGGGSGTGGGAGTTLGRIGFGYVYPNFIAQMTYSSPASNPAQLSIGLFDPSAIGAVQCQQDSARRVRVHVDGALRCGDDGSAEGLGQGLGLRQRRVAACTDAERL